MKRLVQLFISRSDSEHTRRQYKAIVSEWCAFCINPFEATVLQAMEFIAQQKERVGQEGRVVGSKRTVTAQTIARKHIVLRSFQQFLVQRKEAKENIFDFPILKFSGDAEKRPSEPLDQELVRKLCDVPSEHTKKGVLDRAIFACLFGNGCRRGELRDVRCGHVLSGDPVSYIVLRAKDQKTHERRLPPWAGERLMALLKQRLAEGASRADWLFVRYVQGKPVGQIGTKYIYYRFRSALKALALEGYSPHSARASLIAYLREKKVGDKEIMSITGHKTRFMLDRYDRRKLSGDKDPINFVTWGKE